MILVSVQAQQEAEARRVAALKAAQGGADPADSRVSSAVSGLQSAAGEALRAQAADPDARDDPKDAQVWAHLEDAEAAAGEAARDQMMDEGEEDGEPVSGAHAAAEGAMAAAAKAAYADRGIHEGPGHPMMPSQIHPGQFQRPLATGGHQAPSPGHQAPHVIPHVDLTADRGAVHFLNPFNPTGGQRP